MKHSGLKHKVPHLGGGESVRLPWITTTYSSVHRRGVRLSWHPWNEAGCLSEAAKGDATAQASPTNRDVTPAPRCGAVEGMSLPEQVLQPSEGREGLNQ